MSDLQVNAQRLTAIEYLVHCMQDLGKTKLQKLLYFAQHSSNLPLGYDFQMYHYGPFTFALEDDLGILRRDGRIDVEPDAQGFGFHIRPTAASRPDPLSAPLPSSWRIALDNLRAQFGDLSIQELELRATIHFVAMLTESSSDERIRDVVHALKPKFSLQHISSAIREMRLGRLLAN